MGGVKFGDGAGAGIWGWDGDGGGAGSGSGAAGRAAVQVVNSNAIVSKKTLDALFIFIRNLPYFHCLPMVIKSKQGEGNIRWTTRCVTGAGEFG